ncbi:D-beta-D-heptose 1-phosphate adenosyltransferase [Thermotomaculum hydrothermale]|uniref:D-beta-D-heptose 1-phosphate adenosyltransferase n=1 Tax=Thermotomaculum hydrothermale TaxID=981385 RepID=A0A7R6PSJ0_9BACT|nr:adenylyltransferase/cytidyltransferase family protein [Thermotomaculum hydrothermale]BBB33536.1 D-beta-D-heptose 1-phosphate adenosyltransferase [Thermotomaculum hydrothermale]
MTKVYPRERLSEIIDKLKEEGKTIGFANGCFDLLHVGHIRYLKDAKSNCDILVVALNTDESVRRLKGEGRPRTPLNERLEIMEAIEFVDYLTFFGEDTVEETLRILKPHIQFKGTDYTVDTVPEKKVMEELGGRVMIVGDPKDHSTTEILERIKNEKG